MRSNPSIELTSNGLRPLDVSSCQTLVLTMTFAASEAGKVLFSAPPSPLPADFVKVIRWVSAGEAEAQSIRLTFGARIAGSGRVLASC